MTSLKERIGKLWDNVDLWDVGSVKEVFISLDHIELNYKSSSKKVHKGRTPPSELDEAIAATSSERKAKRSVSGKVIDAYDADDDADNDDLMDEDETEGSDAEYNDSTSDANSSPNGEKVHSELKSKDETESDVVMEEIISTKKLLIDEFGKASLYIYASNSYLEATANVPTSGKIKGFFNKLASDTLNLLMEPQCKFDDTNELILFIHNWFKDPPVIPLRTLRAFYIYHQRKNAKLTDFIQVHLINQLFKHNQLSQIGKLIEEFGYSHIECINPVMLTKRDLFMHYYYLFKTCALLNNFWQAYKYFQIMISIGELSNKLIVPLDSLSLIMNEYIDIMIHLNINWRDKDVIFIKYNQLMDSNAILAIENFNKFNIWGFIEFYLVLCQIDYDTPPIFTHDRLKSCLIQLLSKMSSFSHNINAVDEQIENIKQINKILKPLKIKIDKESITCNESNQKSSLLDDLQSLATLNDSLANINAIF
ncbi:hypothetical protein DAMA08_051180 [Martiniozyma asiatica (nom. inval.)]|nr:hypothetical protein DAMA08_051180 [Martiniozyma asiatica]